ncbi:G2/mitotic-specific cyclin-A-like [Pecten maximus]|uniref:G2/mitotic-specific cyclin-A-like n=1 Tax=Pecten maximus TaxID=6579 RepID=UPI001458CA40|nr:G2/mitotic-specific cyclin-A-like [Pecten maximus]
MSTFVFDAFQDSENQTTRRVKNAPRNNAPKRAALGVITNQVRVQPFRAAKAGTEAFQDENTFSRQAKTFGQKEAAQPFSIFVDDQKTLQELKPVSANMVASADTKVQLTDAVTTLNRLREPLSTAANNSLICIDDSIDSPMVLDISHDVAEEEKKPLNREAIITTVPEYAEEIYTHLREAELKNRPKAGYMKKQQDITSSMRCILVDWLVEVSEEYNLHRETLFLAINYIDRFLSTMAVQRGKLQLVGAASMFLASKYEEIYPPDVGEFAYITDDTYTKKQVLRMEHLILKVLKFDISPPTANWFCDHFLKQAGCDDKTKSLAMLLIELSLVDCETFLRYSPSLLSAAATCLASYSMGAEQPWPASMVKLTGYELCHLVECLQDLYNTYCNAPKQPQQAVIEKYKHTKHHEVSNFSKYPPPAQLSL